MRSLFIVHIVVREKKKNKNHFLIDIAIIPDVTPPNLICPEEFSVPMSDIENYATVKIFPPPLITGMLWSALLHRNSFYSLNYFLDNSDDNITYWLKPSVKEDGVNLTIGSHIFTYIAVDAFRNKAKCSFNISVLDITPPSIDNCIDPPDIFVPLLSVSNKSSDNRSFVDWDQPIVHDNSDIDVNVTQSIHPGHLTVGQYSVIYTATDSSGNQNTCTMNVTVKGLQCNTLLSPNNGQSLCAKNATHTWCDVVCDLGYAMYDSGESDQSDNIRFLCENDDPQWKYDPLPECSKVELPDQIEQVFSFTLEDDAGAACNDNNSGFMDSSMHDTLVAQMQQQLCTDSENCQVLSDLPSCVDISKNRIDGTILDEITDRNYYNVIKRKRDVSRSQNRSATTMKFRVYTKISKSIGLWNQSLSRAENLEIIKDELKTYHTNEGLRNQLTALRINVKHLNLEDNLLCKTGSVLKRDVCGNYDR